jgi:DNA (cytosine-5)-methyltransferase 1
MKHLGDITKISGYTAPIVDCIIGGSPCQGLSVAGKGKGLADERSGLFMEQVRIAKEMRKADVQRGRSGVDVRPRYMVWENVPGAFSSNGGDDFRVVLEELARVIEEGVTIPRPPKGKWATTGVIILDGGSLAWKVFDSQWWGVPQRRRRICLLVDFNGHTAPSIVFSKCEHHGSTERGNTKPSVGYIGEESRSKIQSLCEGLPRNLEQSQPQRKDPSSDASGSLGAGDREGARHVGIDLYNTDITGDKAATLGINCGMSHGRNGVLAFEPGATSRLGGYVWEGIASTLRANAGDNQMAVAYKDGNHIPDEAVVYSIENHPADSRVDIDESGKVQTLTSRMGTGGGNVPMVMALDRASFNQGKNAKYDFEVSDKGVNSPIVAKGPSAVCYGIGSYDSNAWKRDNPHSGVYEADTARTLDANNCGYPACNQGGTAVVQGFPEVRDGVVGTLDAHYSNFPGCRGGMERTMVVDSRVRTRYIVRRLTPLECERLQGFPDRWTDIGEYIDSNGKKKQSSDAARYKALGNSIALPPWKWVLKRLCACYERDATMASLFDGIGGFPLIWEQINGKGSCLWASEVENFCIAVTKKRIGD